MSRPAVFLSHRTQFFCHGTNRITVQFPDLHKFPTMNLLFAKYINVIGPQAVQNSTINPLDVLTFWKSVGDRLPGLQTLAKMYLFSVTTSADAERSFSNYNQILSRQRLSLSEDTIRMLEFLYWNHNVVTC